MGLPVSVVVAEIVMQHVKESALATCQQRIPLWLRYIDNTLTAVHKDEIDDFHNHLNEQNANIQGRVVRKPVNVNPGLKVNRGKNFPPIEMLFTAYVLCSLRLFMLKTERQKILGDHLAEKLQK